MFVASLLFSLTLQCAFSFDLGFRFKDGYCQKGNKPGANPEFVGECGNLTSARLIKKTFEEQNLKGLILNSTYTYNSEFRKSQMSHASFLNAVILQTAFKNVDAPSMDFRGSQLKSVHFENSNLKEMLGSGTRFTKVKFINCNLQNAEFWGSELLEVDFSNSDLRGASLKNTIPLFSEFKGAKFDKKTQLPFSEEDAFKKGMIKIDNVSEKAN